jgi:hypothetical protein
VRVPPVLKLLFDGAPDVLTLWEYQTQKFENHRSRRPGLYPRQRQRKHFPSSLCAQTSSEAHPASYPVGTRSPFPGGKTWPCVTLTTLPHLVPSSGMSRSHTSSSWRLHGGSMTALFYTPGLDGFFLSAVLHKQCRVYWVWAHEPQVSSSIGEPHVTDGGCVWLTGLMG